MTSNYMRIRVSDVLDLLATCLSTDEFWKTCRSCNYHSAY